MNTACAIHFLRTKIEEKSTSWAGICEVLSNINQPEETGGGHMIRENSLLKCQRPLSEVTRVVSVWWSYVNINTGNVSPSSSSAKAQMDSPSSHFRLALESNVKINKQIHRLLAGDMSFESGLNHIIFFLGNKIMKHTLINKKIIIKEIKSYMLVD